MPDQTLTAIVVDTCALDALGPLTPVGRHFVEDSGAVTVNREFSLSPQYLLAREQVIAWAGTVERRQATAGGRSGSNDTPGHEPDPEPYEGDRP